MRKVLHALGASVVLSGVILAHVSALQFVICCPGVFVMMASLGLLPVSFAAWYRGQPWKAFLLDTALVFVGGLALVVSTFTGDRVVEWRIHRRMSAVITALEAETILRGAPPRSLEELVPSRLDSVPACQGPWLSIPPEYEVDEDGGWKLRCATVMTARYIYDSKNGWMFLD